MGEVEINAILAFMREQIGLQAQEIAVLKTTIKLLEIPTATD